MSSDFKLKLGKLLNHWIEHNREHSREFSEWAQKASQHGEKTVSREILQAAGEMERSSASLSRALASLEKGEP
jgi:hypothetical protein